jgi:hypothetical protein
MTQTDVTNIMLLEVGAGLDAPSRPELDTISGQIGLLFNFYADKAPVFPRLQYLYAKRHLLMILEGTLRNKVSGTYSGLNVQQSDSVKNVLQMYKETNEEITRVEKIARANRVGVMQPSVTKSPVDGGILNPIVKPLPQTIPALPNGGVNGGQGDPNAPGYRGDPFVEPNGPFVPGLTSPAF